MPLTDSPGLCEKTSNSVSEQPIGDASPRNFHVWSASDEPLVIGMAFAPAEIGFCAAHLRFLGSTLRENQE